mmetsp:Transcript_4130/g.11852  ORF Transcript_4130/g.11852 Transcript_4130/m.11852 type:complete len:245 (+) Transcript_4130:1031-1765(+)
MVFQPANSSSISRYERCRASCMSIVCSSWRILECASSRARSLAAMVCLHAASSFLRISTSSEASNVDPSFVSLALLVGPVVVACDVASTWPSRVATSSLSWFFSAALSSSSVRAASKAAWRSRFSSSMASLEALAVDRASSSLETSLSEAASFSRALLRSSLAFRWSARSRSTLASSTTTSSSSSSSSPSLSASSSSGVVVPGPGWAVCGRSSSETSLPESSTCVSFSRTSWSRSPLMVLSNTC